MKTYYTETFEICPHCGSENVYTNWDCEKQGYIAVCQYCGKEIFLCSECPHNECNSCNWREMYDGVHSGICKMGMTKDNPKIAQKKKEIAEDIEYLKREIASAYELYADNTWSLEKAKEVIKRSLDNFQAGIVNRYFNEKEYDVDVYFNGIYKTKVKARSKEEAADKAVSNFDIASTSWDNMVYDGEEKIDVKEVR